MGGCFSKCGGNYKMKKGENGTAGSHADIVAGSDGVKTGGTPTLVNKVDKNSETNGKLRAKGDDSSSSSSSSSSEDEAVKVVHSENTILNENFSQPNMVTSATSSTVTSVVTTETTKDEATGTTKTTTTQHDQTQVVVSSTSEQVTEILITNILHFTL